MDRRLVPPGSLDESTFERLIRQLGSLHGFLPGRSSSIWNRYASSTPMAW